MSTNLIKNDIIGSIKTNLLAGNITMDAAQKLYSCTVRLYRHIYACYDELEVLTKMTDESYMTEVDIFYKEMEEKDKIIAEKDNAIAEKDAEIQRLQHLLKAR